MAEPTTVEIDFSDVKDFAPLARNVAKGNYKLKVVKIEKGTSKAGNPTWIVDSEFVDGEHAGQQIREYLTLTEKALFKVKSFLDAIHGQRLPKKKIKLPNTSAELTKKFGGKIFGAHIDDGDPYTNGNGETVTKSEIKYHLFAAEVDAQKAQPAAEAVVESTPATPAPAEEAPVSGDVADQLESFDLDEL
jgi:hypothetical protein